MYANPSLGNLAYIGWANKHAMYIIFFNDYLLYTPFHDFNSTSTIVSLS